MEYRKKAMSESDIVDQGWKKKEERRKKKEERRKKKEERGETSYILVSAICSDREYSLLKLIVSS